jgi:hypothetical protein
MLANPDDGPVELAIVQNGTTVIAADTITPGAVGSHGLSASGLAQLNVGDTVVVRVTNSHPVDAVVSIPPGTFSMHWVGR